MKKIMFSVIALALSMTVYAQADTKATNKVTLSMDGQIAVTTNGSAVFTNFGGPGVKMKAGKSVAFSVNMLPSLSFRDNPPRPLVTPTLGVGFQVSYKRLLLCLPFYYVAPKGSSVQEWTFAAGLGYKFNK